MKIALLAPGPSLTQFADREGYLRIAVNRAALLYEARYCVLLDANAAAMLFRDGGPKRKPGERPTMVSLPDQRIRMERICPESASFPFLAVSEIDFPRYDGARRLGWAGWSATTALALAGSLGATQIDCWGVDRTGVEDFDGFTDPLNYRTSDRWRREEADWNDLVRLLETRRIAVRRTILKQAAEA